MEQQLLELLSIRSMEIHHDMSLAQNIIKILDQKQQAITNLSQQITKYKCQQIKNEKLIKSLQEKITQLSPNISNTSSNFMMSSEFKSTFEELMTTLIPNALGWAIGRPYLFSKCVHDVFMHAYTRISDQLNGIMGQICDILNIETFKQHKKDLELKIKLNLLKVFQDDWEIILPFKLNTYEYVDKEGKLSSDLIGELNEGINSEDFVDMQRKLHKLCVYMTLQDKQWQFSSINTGSLVKYSKKQYTCIDGWIKEGDQALLVLGGLKKENHFHPNLKNYVIPLSQDDSQPYRQLNFKIKENDTNPSPQKVEQEPEKIQNSALCNSRWIATQNEVEILPLKPIFIEQQDLITKIKSIQLMKDKENIPYALNKKSKKKDKLKFSMDASLNLPEKSPTNILRKHEKSIKNKKIEIEQMDERIYQISEESRDKKKSLMISKNINEVQPNELMPLKQKNLMELPVSKDVNNRKKSKANTSRKSSVGKIVNQNHMINHDKQNTQSINNSKMKNKQKIYKDIIKEKLLQDKIQEKTQHSLNILFPKAKNDRDKKKEQNRPLKIQNNANKLREKYIL